jgi:hypothetical protein
MTIASSMPRSCFMMKKLCHIQVVLCAQMVRIFYGIGGTPVFERKIAMYLRCMCSVVDS